MISSFDCCCSQDVLDNLADAIAISRGVHVVVSVASSCTMPAPNTIPITAVSHPWPDAEALLPVLLTLQYRYPVTSSFLWIFKSTA